MLFIYFFCHYRSAPMAYGSSQVRGWIGAIATSLCHSHSNVGSELCLWSTPQLTAMPDPQPTERGQGSNPHPHGCHSDLFPLHHDGNSYFFFGGGGAVLLACASSWARDWTYATAGTQVAAVTKPGPQPTREVQSSGLNTQFCVLDISSYPFPNIY